jgi:NADH:ubiquinone oxidoreductase subunit K
MEVVASASQLALVALFIYSGVVKAWSPMAVRRMLEQVAGSRVHLAFALALAAAELLVGLGLLFVPSNVAPRFAVIALAIGFAGAGVVGLRSEQRIRCACYGGHSRPLGWTQLLQFPVFVLLVLAASQGTEYWDNAQALLLFAAILAACGSAPIAKQAQVWSRLRGDRAALEFSIAYQRHSLGGNQ